MARHLFSGGFSLFYWGQGYGGPLEDGADFAHRGGPSGRVGLRAIGGSGAITAAALYWLFPSFLLDASAFPQAGYRAENVGRFRILLGRRGESG